MPWLKLIKIECHGTDDWGNDEVYLRVSIDPRLVLVRPGYGHPSIRNQSLWAKATIDGSTTRFPHDPLTKVPKSQYGIRMGVGPKKTHMVALLMCTRKT